MAVTAASTGHFAIFYHEIAMLFFTLKGMDFSAHFGLEVGKPHLICKK